ncbi:MAG: tetratricopeptide repeat protein [Acidobacteriota bacterium]
MRSTNADTRRRRAARWQPARISQQFAAGGAAKGVLVTKTVEKCGLALLATLALAMSSVAILSGDTLPSAAGVRPIQFNARLAGTVTDAEGKPLEGVKVTIHREGQDPSNPVEDIELRTNKKGGYYRRNVRLGMTQINFEMEGFQTVVKEINLKVGPTRLDITMKPGVAASRNAAAELYSAGVEAFEDKRFVEAISLMKQVLDTLGEAEADPKVLASVYAVIGRSHFEQKEYEQAVQAYEQWQKLAPDDTNARLELDQARAAQAGGESPQGRRHARRSGENTLSGGSPQRANDASDDAMDSYNKGVVLVAEGKVDEGIEALEQALRLQPVYPLAHKNLGFAYARNGDLAKAAEHLRAYLEQNPEAEDKADIEQFIKALEGQTA